MAPGEYGPVVLTGRLVQSGRVITPTLPDAHRQQKVALPSSPQVGEVIGLAVIGDDRGCLLHFEMQASKGSGRIISLGFDAKGDERKALRLLLSSSRRTQPKWASRTIGKATST